MGTRIEVVHNGEAADGVEVELTGLGSDGGYELTVSSREGFQAIRIKDRDRLLIERAWFGREARPAQITTDYAGKTILRWGYDFRLDFQPVAGATGAAFGGEEVARAA